MEQSVIIPFIIIIATTTPHQQQQQQQQQHSPQNQFSLRIYLYMEHIRVNNDRKLIHRGRK
jgi:hypothetical protein